MNLVLEEMGNALIKALKPTSGVPLLTEVAQYERELRKKNFYIKAELEDKKWQRENRLEIKRMQKDEIFR